MHNLLSKSLPIPITLISTRDCFVFDLFIRETLIDMGPKREQVLKKEYFFKPGQVPANYRQVVGLPKNADLSNIDNLRVGVTTFENFYSNEEMVNMERKIEDTERKSLLNSYLPMTAQKTFSGNYLKRTKFFFGYRYMWTKTQL